MDLILILKIVNDLNFNIYSASCSFNNDIINIKNSSINVSESDFTFTGELESFIPYLLQKTDKMYIRGDLNSSTMLFSELMTIKDEKDIIFTPSEINTGVTNGKQIIITRCEEAFKTIIHELIHFHNLDFKNTPEFLVNYCCFIQKYENEKGFSFSCLALSAVFAHLL